MADPLNIVSLDSKARGIGRLTSEDDTSGKVVFVEGALPGERVMYRSHRVRPSYEQASVVNTLRQSASRVTPQCKFFGACGGCSMQHLDSRAQVAIRQRVPEDGLWYLAKLRPDVALRPVADLDWGYCYRAHLTVRHVAARDGVLVGFREHKSSYVADMTSYEVLPLHVSTLLAPLRELMSRLSIVQRMSQTELTIGQDVAALVLHNLEPITAEDEAELHAFADHHSIQSWLQPKGPDTVYPFYPLDRTLTYTLPEFGITMPFKPTDFTQVNHQINRVLMSRALELLDAQPGDRLLDLFCGIDNFTLPMATHAREVMSIEGSEALTTRTLANAQHNGLDAKTRFACRNLLEVTAGDIAALGKSDRWPVDPSHEGALTVSRALVELSQHGGEEVDLLPKRIVCVSCNPATLVRDVGLLVHEVGYRLAGAGMVNMFPYTSHVGSIAVFERD